MKQKLKEKLTPSHESSFFGGYKSELPIENAISSVTSSLSQTFVVKSNGAAKCNFLRFNSLSYSSTSSLLSSADVLLCL